MVKKMYVLKNFDFVSFKIIYIIKKNLSLICLLDLGLLMSSFSDRIELKFS